MGKRKLSPTLWRTCRVLMNEVRLRLLWAVVRYADQLNVTGISRELGMPQPIATMGLRALQARGLIGVRRERYSVYYNLKTDRSLPEATRLREAFRRYFESTELTDDWTAQMMVMLKAFTHFNRLAMLRRLAVGEATKADLEKASGVVVKTVEHHLRCLSRAGLIEVQETSGGVSIYRLAKPSHLVAQELLRQTLEGDESYFNATMGSENDLRLVHDNNGNRGFIKLDTRPIYD